MPLAYASLGGVGDILLFVVVFCCILFLAYMASKFVARRAAPRGRGRGGRMEIVDSLFVGADAQLIVLKVAGEYFLIAKSAKKLELLAKLDGGEDGGFGAPPGAGGQPFGDGGGQGAAPGSFTESFRTLLERKLSRASRKQDGEPGAFRGNIDRIRGLTKNAGDGKDDDEDRTSHE